MGTCFLKAMELLEGDCYKILVLGRGNAYREESESNALKLEKERKHAEGEK